MTLTFGQIMYFLVNAFKVGSSKDTGNILCNNDPEVKVKGKKLVFEIMYHSLQSSHVAFNLLVLSQTRTHAHPCEYGSTELQNQLFHLI